MFCNKCGAELENGAFFCSSCGEKCQDYGTNSPVYDNNLYVQDENIPAYNTGANYNQGLYYQDNTTPVADYADPNQAPLYPVQEYAEVPTFAADEGISPAVEEFILTESPDKGNKFLKVFVPIISGIVFLCLIALIFGKAIFFAVAPEAYVANLIKNTSDKLSKEMNQIEKNVFGFDIAMDNEMTAGVKVNYKDAYSKHDFDISIANNPKKSKLLFEGNYENDYGKGSGHGFVGNETAGLILPGSDNKYLSIPTKDFGKEFKSADGFMTDYMSRDAGDGREKAFDIISTLDLSYDNLKQASSADKKTSQKINKHIADNLIKLLKDSEIGSRQRTKHEFEGKTVGAHEITLSVEGKEIYDCYINILKSIAKDDKIKKVVDYNAILDIIEEMENEAVDSDTDISDYEIKLIEYSGKIVSVEISYTQTYEYNDEYPEYGDYSSTTKTENILILSVTNKKDFLNGIRIVTSEKEVEDYKNPEQEDYSRENQTEISFTSDWATKRKMWNKDKITVAMLISADYESDDYSHSNEGTLDFLMDFEKGNWSLDIKEKNKSDDDSSTDRQSYEGKCSKKDGFSFTVNKKWTDNKYDYTYSNSKSYDEWINDEFDRYHDDYLEHIYNENFLYDYDSFYDWSQSDSRDEWDVADSDFKDWLYDEEYYYYDSLEDAYNSETQESEEIATPVDAYVKFEFTLKDDVGIKEKDGKNDNILDWSEDDFYEFGDAFMEEIKK